MTNEAMEGNEWAAYGALVRTAKAKHGIAYPPRGERRRSLHSNPRTGKPFTW
jgi:hypothetical protein